MIAQCGQEKQNLGVVKERVKSIIVGRDKAANGHASKKFRCTRRRALAPWHCITERSRSCFVGYMHVGLAEHLDQELASVLERNV
jgi:hypothetical protein